jgi:plastocyanin
MKHLLHKTPAAISILLLFAAATATAQEVTLSISADNIAFNKSELSAPAGAEVTIVFDNKEAVPHNVAVYETSDMSSEIFVGEVITGPQTIEYTFTAPDEAGEYFFVCDVHPRTMTGTFIVTE